jgi:hypothetical protein
MQSNFGYILPLDNSNSLGFSMSSQEQKYTYKVLCGGSFNYNALKLPYCNQIPDI